MDLKQENQPIKNFLHDVSLEYIQDNRLYKDFDIEFAPSGEVSFARFNKDYTSFRTFKNLFIKHKQEITLEETYDLVVRIQKETKEINDEINLLVSELNKLKGRRDQMKMMKHCPTKKIKNDKNEKREENQKRRAEIYDKLTELNQQIKAIKTTLFPFPINDNLFTSLCEIKTPKELLLMPGIKVFESAFQVYAPLNKCDECLQILHQKIKEPSFEIVPICSVIIFNSKRYGISDKLFVSQISDICNKFGSVALEEKPYQVCKNSFANGSIEVRLLSNEFLLQFVNEINDIFNSNEKQK